MDWFDGQVTLLRTASRDGVAEIRANARISDQALDQRFEADAGRPARVRKEACRRETGQRVDLQEVRAVVGRYDKVAARIVAQPEQAVSRQAEHLQAGGADPTTGTGDELKAASSAGLAKWVISLKAGK